MKATGVYASTRNLWKSAQRSVAARRITTWSNKISRVGFTAAFLIQCLEAIGCHSVRLDEA